MNTKMIALLMLVMLFATPVLAAITVTINTPTSGESFNNLPANLAPVDINFTVTDDNATVIDHTVTVIVYDGTTWSTFATVTSDMNVRNTGTGEDCTATEISDIALYTCSINWDMPGSASMTEGPYYIDVNVVSVSPGDTQEDTNAFAGINISNTIANSATIQGLLLVISIVIAAGLLITAVLSIGVLGADPAKTAIALVSAGIVAAVLMSILGVIALMI